MKVMYDACYPEFKIGGFGCCPLLKRGNFRTATCLKIGMFSWELIGWYLFCRYAVPTKTWSCLTVL